MTLIAFARFHNALRILLSIDQPELVGAGVLASSDREAWEDFRSDPYRWFIGATQRNALAVWAIIEQRQPNGIPIPDEVPLPARLFFGVDLASGPDSTVYHRVGGLPVDNDTVEARARRIGEREMGRRFPDDYWASIWDFYQGDCDVRDCISVFRWHQQALAELGAPKQAPQGSK
jgi:hypothetical protein